MALARHCRHRVRAGGVAEPTALGGRCLGGIATLGFLWQQDSVALGRAETGAGRRAQRRARRWLWVKEWGPPC